MFRFTLKALMVDDVLINGRPRDEKHWSTDLKTDLGLSPSLLYERFFTPFWDKIVTGKLDLLSALKPVLSDLAPHLTAENFIAYWFKNDARLNTEMIESLKFYRTAGVRIYLATNQEHLRAEYITQTLKLGELADAVYYSAALGVKKPDHAFFEKVTDLSTLRPEEIVLIDDTLTNIIAAKECGWHAIHWTNKSCLATELAQF
ncbi:HAD-IA family hydrolase [Bacillus subtilis]|uniref:HAD-IA family hydrolase n=1 Tax=Pseudochrobactrum asaccharolyticum TaxID=354351 RepID=UPI001F01CCF4|nr:HAD-IA family hydrolase [Pseudochrobactrum asaccharolyticum]MCF7644637.1 HAD-IA family hydrolase [Pseudochrobactrum asaccharolyticum]MCF7670124.1 HAD-IA family hydrolase [Bacillus subtilis]